VNVRTLVLFSTKRGRRGKRDYAGCRPGGTSQEKGQARGFRRWGDEDAAKMKGLSGKSFMFCDWQEARSLILHVQGAFEEGRGKRRSRRRE